MTTKREYKPGDKITLTVKSIRDDEVCFQGHNPLRNLWLLKTSVDDSDCEYVPAPRVPKEGDTVTWGTKLANYSVAKIIGDSAVVYRSTDGKVLDAFGIELAVLEVVDDETE